MNWIEWAQQVNAIRPNTLPENYEQVSSGRHYQAPIAYEQAELFFHLGKSANEYVEAFDEQFVNPVFMPTKQ